MERNGNFYAVVRVDGRQRWLAAGTSKRKAQMLHDEWVVKARKGELVIPKPITLAEFAELFIEDYCKVALKPVTISEYEGYLTKYLIPAFGSMRMSSIRHEHVQRYVSRLVREGRLSPKSIANQLVPLRRMFTIAQQWGYANHNPAKGIALPRSERKEMSILAPREMRLLIDATPVEWKALIAVGCLLGLRKGEALGLQWDAVLWDEHRIDVRKSLWGGQLQEPKTKKSSAKVPMTRRVEALLMERMTLSPASELDLVFCRVDGSPLRPDWVNRGLLEPALKKAGLPRVSYHQLRHSCISAHIAAGTNVKVVQELARHASIQTTLDLYSHVLPESKLKAAKVLEEAVWGRREDG